jgi:hypothetical protein
LLSDDGAKFGNKVAYHFAGFVCDGVPEGVVVLNADCQAQAQEFVHERLLLAGARLARLVDHTLVTAATFRRPE